MKIYKEYEFWNWPQVMLNGLIRPRRFFSSSHWEGSLLLSLPLLTFWIFASTVVYMELTEKLNWALATRTSVFQMLVFFLLGLFVELLKGKIRLSFSPTRLVSFLSYTAMVYATMLGVFYLIGEWYAWVSYVYAVWVGYGFTHAFSDKSNSPVLAHAVRVLCGICLVAPAVYLQTHMADVHLKNDKIIEQWNAEMEYAKKEMQKVEEIYQDYSTKPNQYEDIIKRGVLKVGDRFQYNVRFWRSKQRMIGTLNILVEAVTSQGNVHLAVTSKFGKKIRQFKKLVNTSELTKDRSMMNKNQKPGHLVALGLVTTAFLSLDQLPKYEDLGWHEYMKHVTTRRTSSGGITGFEVSGLPNIVYLSSGETEKTAVSVSRRVGLPLAVRGKMPDTQVNYKIDLGRFSRTTIQ